jgi:diacylglycerol kinase (ATP)
MEKRFTWSGRLHSFGPAWRGLCLTFRSQHNAWIHATATAVVIPACWVLRLSRLEGCAVVLCCVAVWTAEAMNTALEMLADAVKPERHPLVGKAKDAAAGAVLVAALGSAGVALLVFGPHLRSLFSG